MILIPQIPSKGLTLCSGNRVTSPAWRWPLRMSVITVLGLALTACGSREIRDLPPLVRLSQVQLHGSAADVQVRVENPNDIPFRARTIQFALELEASQPLSFNGITDVDIVPRSAEEVNFRFELPQRLAQRLRGLQARESIPWRLEGVLPQTEGREWPFKARGVLFPVPGVDGVYRASAIGSAYPIRRSR